MSRCFSYPSYTSGATWMDKAVLWVVMLSTGLTEDFIFPGISVADVAVIGTCVYIIIRSWPYGISLLLPANFSLITVLWLWAGLDFLLVSNYIYTNIDGGHFLRSFAKLSFSIGAYLILFRFFSRVGEALLCRILVGVLVVHAVIAFYVYAAMSLSLGLPYEFLWYGQESGSVQAYFQDTEYIRAKGMFSEPAVFGYFQTLGLGFLWVKNDGKIPGMYWQYGIILLSILLTMSLSAYSLMLTIIALRLLQGHDLIGFVRTLCRKVIPLAMVLAGIMTFLVYCTPFGDSFDDVLGNRLTSVTKMNDDSSTTRILGSWELPFAAFDKSPLLGTGLGNLEAYHSTIASYLRYTAESGYIHNIFAVGLGTLGPLGLLLLVLISRLLILQNRQLGWLFVVSMFATGSFLDCTFWFFLCLYHLPSPTDERLLSDKTANCAQLI